jgi:hypothetical protein
MPRFAAVASLVGALIVAPATVHADGMPAAKHLAHKVVHHRHIAARVMTPAVAQVHCERPSSPPEPWWTLYDRVMVDYFQCPSITGYRPGSGTEESDGVRYHRVADWSARPARVPPLAPRPPQIDAFPYRTQAGPQLLQYDSVVGTYVALSAYGAQRAAAAMAASATPVPLIR